MVKSFADKRPSPVKDDGKSEGKTMIKWILTSKSTKKLIFLEFST